MLVLRIHSFLYSRIVFSPISSQKCVLKSLRSYFSLRRIHYQVQAILVHTNTSNTIHVFCMKLSPHWVLYVDHCFQMFVPQQIKLPSTRYIAHFLMSICSIIIDKYSNNSGTILLEVMQSKYILSLLKKLTWKDCVCFMPGTASFNGWDFLLVLFCSYHIILLKELNVRSFSIQPQLCEPGLCQAAYKL